MLPFATTSRVAKLSLTHQRKATMCKPCKSTSQALPSTSITQVLVIAKYYQVQVLAKYEYYLSTSITQVLVLPILPKY